MAKKNTEIIVAVTQRMKEMAIEIQEKRGLMSKQEAIRQSISETYARLFPAYTIAPKRKLTPEEKIEFEDDRKNARIKRKRQELLDICESLGGQVKIETGGDEVCHYYTYSGKKRYAQEIPLDMLTNDLVKTQYQPSRAKVFQLRREKKVDY